MKDILSVILTLTVTAALLATGFWFDDRIRTLRADVDTMKASAPAKTATIKVRPTIDSKGKIGLGVDLGAALKF